tara:strand:- start:538 stop:705 length:168 start_codon:yes stop_codon:yes gene_type:complete
LRFIFKSLSLESYLLLAVDVGGVRFLLLGLRVALLFHVGGGDSRSDLCCPFGKRE